MLFQPERARIFGVLNNNNLAGQGCFLYAREVHLITVILKSVDHLALEALLVFLQQLIDRPCFQARWADLVRRISAECNEGDLRPDLFISLIETRLVHTIAIYKNNVAAKSMWINKINNNLLSTHSSNKLLSQRSRSPLPLAILLVLGSMKWL